MVRLWYSTGAKSKSLAVKVPLKGLKLNDRMRLVGLLQEKKTMKILGGERVGIRLTNRCVEVKKIAEQPADTPLQIRSVTSEQQFYLLSWNHSLQAAKPTGSFSYLHRYNVCLNACAKYQSNSVSNLNSSANLDFF